MTCEKCGHTAARIRWTPEKGWDCPSCAAPERAAVNTYFSERLQMVPGFGWVTRRQSDEWRDNGAFIERQVDPRTGDVTTKPMSRRAGTRKYFQMGG